MTSPTIPVPTETVLVRDLFAKLERYDFTDQHGHPLRNCLDWRDLRSQQQAMRDALAWIAEQCPKEDPGPAWDQLEGYRSEGNRDDVIRDVCDENMWPIGERARAALAASPALASPVPSDAGVKTGALLYRPNSFDDWGMIRTEDGEAFATVTRPLGRAEADEYRKSGVDPFEPLARALVAALSGGLVPSVGMDQEAVAGEQWAVSSRTGIHIGLWRDEAHAREALREYEGGSIQPLVPASALSAERAAHEREKHRHFLTAQASARLVQSLCSERNVARECHAHALDLAKKEIARAEALEAQVANLTAAAKRLADQADHCLVGFSIRGMDIKDAMRELAAASDALTAALPTPPASQGDASRDGGEAI